MTIICERSSIGESLEIRLSDERCRREDFSGVPARDEIDCQGAQSSVGRLRSLARIFFSFSNSVWTIAGSSA